MTRNKTKYGFNQQRLIPSVIRLWDMVCVLFLVLRKQLVWCFPSIKRGVTIVISYGNILQLMTTLFLNL